MFRTAIRFIIYDRAKSIGIVIGIVISAFLIGQQLGILTFLTDLMQSIVQGSKAQIWVIDSDSRDANQSGSLDKRLLAQIKSVPGVEQAFPILVAGASAKFKNGKTGGVILIGSDAPTFIAGPQVNKISNGELSELLVDGAVTGDFFERKNLGDGTGVGTEFEINGKRVFIAVETKGLRGFGGNYLYTTIDRARYLARAPKDKISAVLVTIQKETLADSVVSAINRSFYGVRAWKSQDLAATTVATVLGNSGIATSVGSLVVFAVISGFFIIGLTMYSAALDRLQDYGVMKAIGANNKDIRNLILSQSLIFAIVGFLLSMLLLNLFKNAVSNVGLVFEYRPTIVIGIFVVILFISLGGAWFALRKIKQVEPASVFRG